MGLIEKLCDSFSLRSRALEMEEEALALWLTARDGIVNIAIIACLCNIVEVWQGPDFYFENATVGSFLTKRMCGHLHFTRHELILCCRGHGGTYGELRRFVPSNFSSVEDERRVGLLLPVFSDISTIPMVWDWLESNIVPTFAEPEPRLLASNRLLGKVRLRQLRVRDNTCSMGEVSSL